jgi:6-methylsalicylate decarboxylase
MKAPRLFRTCLCCEPSSVPVAASRRNFIAGGVVALGVGALGARAGHIGAAGAQGPAERARIDVHHHFIPSFHVDAMMAPGRRLGAPPPQWSPSFSLEEMDRSGIATAVLSVAQPGTWYGDNVEECRSLTRRLNEYGAMMVRDFPGRFGLFACIAPPDVEGSLKEVEFAFAALKTDGVALLTSYQEKYLGEASFAPIYEELNRRNALVYVHPTTPACCRGLLPGIPPSSIEYATDTTRTIAHLVFSGTAARYPHIRWIFSHSGGTLPFLLGRFTRLAQERKPAHLPDGPLPAFRKFHYEVAQGNTPGQLAALLRMVPVSQLLYGTDYPFRHGAEVNKGIEDWGFDAADLRAIERENSRRLLPRLKLTNAQPATALHFAARCSAPRSDRANAPLHRSCE